MIENFELLQELAETPGMSGYEDGISHVLCKELENIFINKPVKDSYENILIEEMCQNDGPTILIAAHMDEIGLTVKRVDYEEEKVYFEKMGNILDNNLIGKEVHVVTPEGLVSGIIEINEGTGKFISLAKKSDIGKIKLGSPIFLSSTVCKHANNRISGKAFDDRIGCFAILEMLKRIDFDEINGTLQIAFLSKAELGLGGIMHLKKRPDFILFVDAVDSGDVPGSDSDIGLGEGVVLPIIEKSTGCVLCVPKCLNIIENVARNAGIKYQAAAIHGESCLNDTVRNLYNACPNVSTVLLPVRYLHTSAELIDLYDVEECVNLLTEITKIGTLPLII